MRSTVHEARQGEAREPMRVRWLLRTAHSRRYVRTRSRMLSNASECAADCARARGVHARWQPTSCKIDPRVDFTRHSKRARGCLMAGCDRTWQEIPFAARPGGRSLLACHATTLTTICVTTQRGERSDETTRVHATFKATRWRTWALDDCAGRHRAGDLPVRSLALSKRGYTGAICARARPEHVFQASRANAKISLSDQRHEPRRRRTIVLVGCLGRGKEGEYAYPQLDALRGLGCRLVGP